MTNDREALADIVGRAMSEDIPDWRYSNSEHVADAILAEGWRPPEPMAGRGLNRPPNRTLHESSTV